MGLPKGKTNNPAGRKAGTPNKSTSDLRITVQYFLEKNMTSLQENFDMLEPRDKLLFVEKMLKYTLPTLQAVDNTLNVDNLSDESITAIFNKLLNPKK